MRPRVVIVVLSLLLGALPAAAEELAASGEDLVYTGAYSDDWVAAGDLGRLSQIGNPLTFGGTFHHPGEGHQNTYWILEQVWQAGATPVANLEIFATSYEIAAGFHDAAITDWAAGVQQWLAAGEGRSLFLAPLVEMNGDWVPWGMDPGNYQIAFRRIHGMLTELGLDETQVRWIWGPNSSSSPPFSITDYWPGEDVVDVVGLSVYNFGGSRGWWDVWPIMDPAMAQLRSIAPDTPYLITQTGTGSIGGDKNRWIMDLFDYAAADPNLVGLVYFNFDKESDWKVWDERGVAWGWLAANTDARVGYQFPLTDWFQPGPIPFAPTPEQVDRQPEGPSVMPSFEGGQFEHLPSARHVRPTKARPE
ncbi:MAG: glycosyl hydrolase [Acidimicrobiia bacterium]|nr:glycosyl hydrolase [Acidimicrobiia bacterium]